jgi:hypothetical protein
MAKLLTDDVTSGRADTIGEDGMLRFIDEINEIRARSGQRWRLRPVRLNGRLCVDEWCEIEWSLPANTPSRRYAGQE